MSVSGFSTHSSAESDESIAFSDLDEIPPQGSLVPVLQHLLEEKGGTEAIQDMLAGLGLVTLARLDKDAAAGAATSAGPAAGPAAHFSRDDALRRLPAVGWRTSTSLLILQMYCMFVLMRQGLQVMQTRFLQSLLHDTRVCQATGS